MHVIVPFAAPPALPLPQGLRLPNLAMLVLRSGALADRSAAGAAPGADAVGAADDPRLTLTPPHERALARAMGMPGGDGTLPWAAWHALQAGLDGQDGMATRAWGLVTPCHWHLGTEQLSMVDPVLLALDEAAAAELMDAVRPLFEGEGYALHRLTPGAWLIAHDTLDGLPCASPDRVIGRNVDGWLGADARMRRVRLLQSEVQMLLHTHPLNAAREDRGDLTVNSFWLSGCGRLPALWQAAALPTVADGLRAAALAGDAIGWAGAFEALDARVLGPLAAAADRGEPVTLTLCGEARSVDLLPHAGAARSNLALWWRRAADRLGRLSRPASAAADDPRTASAWQALLGTL
jgi:hypothetical protein